MTGWKYRENNKRINQKHTVIYHTFKKKCNHLNKGKGREGEQEYGQICA